MQHQKPQATIFADASSHHQEKVAGFGCWLISDHKPREVFSGKCKWHLSSDIVEMYALIEALKIAREHGFVTSDTSCIVLQSDSLNALDIIRTLPNTYSVKVRHPGDKPVTPARNVRGPIFEVSELISSFSLVYLKHVKGHMQGNYRNNINAQCDTLAKKAMRAQLHNP